MQPYHRDMLSNGHRFGMLRGVPGMLHPPPHSLPPPPNFMPPRLQRFNGPPPLGSPADMMPPGLPPPSSIPPPQLFPGSAQFSVAGPPPGQVPPGMVVMPPRREFLPPPPVHLALPPPRSLPPPPVGPRGMIPDLRSPPPSLRTPDWMRPPDGGMNRGQRMEYLTFREAVPAQLPPPPSAAVPRFSMAIQQPPSAGAPLQMTNLQPPQAMQPVYHQGPPPTMLVAPAAHVNPAFIAPPPSSVAAPLASVAMVSQTLYSDPYIRPAVVSSSSNSYLTSSTGSYITADMYNAPQSLQQPRELSRSLQPVYERSERTAPSGSSSSAAAVATHGRYTPSERHVARRARTPERRESSSSVKLTEREFDDILQRNKSVSSGAIMRAVQDASAGEFASAIETLVTAISLIKQSRIANDDRCKILISSLQDTLHGIESKSYGSKSLSSRSNERRSSSDYEKTISSRSLNAVVRNRSRSPRDHEIRSREYSRSGGGEPRGSSRDPEPRVREYSSRSAVVLETSRIASREDEPRSREYASRNVVAAEPPPPRGSSREAEVRSREYRRAAGESRGLSNEKDRYYEPVLPASSSTIERSRSERSERADRERVVAERDVERAHRSERTERDYADRIERDAERIPGRERASERVSERDSERTRERAERDYVERDSERVARERVVVGERDFTDRPEREYVERDSERHRDRGSERDYGERTERDRDRGDRDRDYAIRSSRHYSSQKHSQL